MAEIIAKFFFVTLLSNLSPIINAIAFGALTLCGILLRRKDRAAVITDYSLVRTVAVLTYAYCIFSYLLTRAPLLNLVSYSFLRWDGAVLIGYLPLLTFGDVGLGTLQVLKICKVYLVLSGLLGYWGFLQYLALVYHLTIFRRIVWYGSWAVIGAGNKGSTWYFHGLYYSHNAPGSLFVISTFGCLAFMLSRKTARDKYWSLFAFLGNAFGALLTESRSGYLALMGGFLCWLVGIVYVGGVPARQMRLYASLLVVPVVFALLSENVRARIMTMATAFSSPDVNVMSRLESYKRALEYFASSPLMGIGFGRWNDENKVFSGVRGVVYIATGGKVVNNDKGAHNGYLEFLSEGGIVELSLFLGIYVGSLLWARHWTKKSVGRCEAIGAWIQFAIVSTFAFSMTEQVMYMASTPWLIFSLMGLYHNCLAWERRVLYVKKLHSGLPNSVVV